MTAELSAPATQHLLYNLARAVARLRAAEVEAEEAGLNRRRRHGLEVDDDAVIVEAQQQAEVDIVTEAEALCMACGILPNREEA